MNDAIIKGVVRILEKGGVQKNFFFFGDMKPHPPIKSRGPGYSMLIDVTRTRLLEVSERRLYGQPFYDPFQLRKETAL